MKRHLPGLMASLAAAASLWAQGPDDPNEGSRFEFDSTHSIYTFSWWGRAGRTYFVQRSEGLLDWSYVPGLIEPGDGSVVAWDFAIPENRLFLRLQSTDIPTDDPEGDDFDGDGVSNADELAAGTDPFSFIDSDSDGLSDDWEMFHFGNLSHGPGSIEDGGTLTNKEHADLGLNPLLNESATAGVRRNYTYDPVGRLTGASGPAATIGYTPDAEGKHHPRSMRPHPLFPMHLLRISFFILLTSVIGFAEEGPGWVESERPSPEQGLAWAAPARGGSAHPGGERWDESTEATPLEEAMSLGEASSAESPAGQPMALTAGGNEADEVTPAIAELARGLRYDPLKIFQYVYNYIEYEPYFGSKKGAHLTLLEGSGNEFDQCALLVALLRAADLNPSYKYGPCSFTYNELVSWMGLSATPYDHWTNTEFAAYYGITDTSSGNIAKLRQWLGVYEFLTPRGYFYVDSFQSGGTNFFSLPHYELVRQSNGTYTVTKQGKTNQK